MAVEIVKKPLRLPQIEIFLAILACLSMALIVSPQTFFTWKKEIDPLNFPARISGDASTGGNSKPVWIDEKQHKWKCNPGSITPHYCTFNLDVRNEDGEGLDLTDFSEMRVWLDYSGNSDSVRIMLRNAVAPYYREAEYLSTKYNLVSIPVSKLEDGVALDREAFTVANWWLAGEGLEHKTANPEFQNIIFIEVQTGNGFAEAEDTFKLKKLAWEGTMFSNETIYRGLVVAWSALIIFLLCWRVIKLRYTLFREKREQEELQELNQVLELQNKEFAELARTDQLTGLCNRLGIRDAIFDSFQEWEQSHRPFSLIMVDIDHFKRINDRFGHEVGDDVLRRVAAIFSEHTRDTDWLARWGGEEFILACRDTDLLGAHRTAEHLRETLYASTIHPKFRVSASFGVAAISYAATLEELFKQADLALYEAKKSGRNCVHSATEIISKAG